MTSYLDLRAIIRTDMGLSVPRVDNSHRSEVLKLEREILEYASRKFGGDIGQAITDDEGFLRERLGGIINIARLYHPEDDNRLHREQLVSSLLEGRITLPPEVKNSLNDMYRDPKGGCNSYTPQTF